MQTGLSGNTIILSLSPGGMISGITSVSLSSGVATFTGLKISSYGTYFFLADSSGMQTGKSASSYTITQSLASIQMISSNSNPGIGVSFTITSYLYGPDFKLFSVSSTVTLTELGGHAITGTTSVTTTTGIATFTISFASIGVMVLSTTCSGITGTLSLNIGSSYVTLSLSGTIIVNTYTTVVSSLFDPSGNLIGSSSPIASGTVSGSVSGSTTGVSSTGYITYNLYFTVPGTQTISVTHQGVSSSTSVTVLSNTATIIPSADFSYSGSTLTYQVYLVYQPVSNEIITITGSSTQFSISPSSLTFTAANYNTPQTVTVTVLTTAATGK